MFDDQREILPGEDLVLDAQKGEGTQKRIHDEANKKVREQYEELQTQGGFTLPDPLERRPMSEEEKASADKADAESTQNLNEQLKIVLIDKICALDPAQDRSTLSSLPVDELKSKFKGLNSRT